MTGALHGYTLSRLDRLARTTIAANRQWWPAGDRDAQYAAAWAGIAEHLCTATEPPSERDLLTAGTAALAREVKDLQRHHGARTDSGGNGTKFARYWEWHGRAVPSPELAVTEHLAVIQILPTLTPGQRDALTALAVTGDYAAGAQALGISPKAFERQVNLGRRRFRTLWHEGETPSRHWRPDRRVARRDTTDPAELAARAAYAARKRAERAALAPVAQRKRPADLKRRQCGFDSRRGHHHQPRPRRDHDRAQPRSHPRRSQGDPRPHLRLPVLRHRHTANQCVRELAWSPAAR